MRRFDPEIYDNTQTPKGLHLDSPKNRDPYFEKYTYDLFQQMGQNPSVIFNFFLENNDIFRRINKEDERSLFLAWVNRQYTMAVSAFGTLIAVIVYDKVLMPRIMKERPFRLPKYRLLAFITKYLFWPWMGTRVADWALDIDEKYKTAAIKYNFGYDDFAQAMNIFERAKIVGLLDELLEKRGQFDFKKLEGVDTTVKPLII